MCSALRTRPLNLSFECNFIWFSVLRNGRVCANPVWDVLNYRALVSPCSIFRGFFLLFVFSPFSFLSLFGDSYSMRVSLVHRIVLLADAAVAVIDEDGACVSVYCWHVLLLDCDCMNETPQRSAVYYAHLCVCAYAYSAAQRWKWKRRKKREK